MDGFNGIDITEDELREAVLSGAVCPRCGGVHLYTCIDNLIKFPEENIPVPVCTCEDCEMCGPTLRATRELEERGCCERCGLHHWYASEDADFYTWCTCEGCQICETAKAAAAQITREMDTEWAAYLRNRGRNRRQTALSPRDPGDEPMEPLRW